MSRRFPRLHISRKYGILILLFFVSGAFISVFWWIFPNGIWTGITENAEEKEIIGVAQVWNVSLGERFIVPNKSGISIYPITPDGHISMLSNPKGGWWMFWPEYESYRSWGFYPYPESQLFVTPREPVVGGRIDEERFNNGGSWLMSVVRVNASHVLGLIHAEDHWYPRNPNGIAWKSLGIAQSTDNGETWTDAELILSCWVQKPATPMWGGAGDGTMVWDANNSRWICIYQEFDTYGLACLHLAISTDPLAAPGSWYKWNGQNFTTAGLGGHGSPLVELREHPGANPSIHWNTYLSKWIIVYGGWDNKTYISSSEDLISWSHPEVLVESDQNGRAWYPTILSDSGDTIAGKKATLYYADLTPDISSRKFYGTPLEFSRI